MQYPPTDDATNPVNAKIVVITDVVRVYRDILNVPSGFFEDRIPYISQENNIYTLGYTLCLDQIPSALSVYFLYEYITDCNHQRNQEAVIYESNIAQNIFQFARLTLVVKLFYVMRK